MLTEVDGIVIEIGGVLVLRAVLIGLNEGEGCDTGIALISSVAVGLISVFAGCSGVVVLFGSAGGRLLKLPSDLCPPTFSLISLVVFPCNLGIPLVAISKILGPLPEDPVVAAPELTLLPPCPVSPVRSEVSVTTFLGNISSLLIVLFLRSKEYLCFALAMKLFWGLRLFAKPGSSSI